MEHVHPTPWRQFDVQFDDRATAERDAVAHLGPALRAASTDGLIGPWFFIRKQPWRFRYLPASTGSEIEILRLLTDAAASMVEAGAVVSQWTANIYEPEEHAFGGSEAMELAHRLFAADSAAIFAYAQPNSDTPVNRRELSVMLCAAMLRGAGLESYERGDVWAKTADEFRPLRDADPNPERWESFRKSVRRLTSANTRPGSELRTGTLAFAEEWMAAFEEFGRDLAALWRAGRLTRGFRAILAHHVIFHWNRFGLDYTAQSHLALAAKQNAFGTGDNEPRPARATTCAPRASRPAPGPATGTFRDTSPTHSEESPMTLTAAEDQATELRNALVDKLVANGRITTPGTEKAFRTVRRHEFAPEADLTQAYADDAVHTKKDGGGQLTSSVSAPWLQALMIEQARLRLGARVLEIGSGGYQAALLREIVGPDGAVTTLDIDPDITARARLLLDQAGYDDVEVVTGDGEFGWDAGAPYDAIIVTVQAADVPTAWTEQITPGGRLVVPLRMFGQNRTLAFTVAGPRMIADRSIFSGFVTMQGAGGFEAMTRVVHLNDSEADLTFLGTAPEDPEALAGALAHKPAQLWTGIAPSGRGGYVGDLQLYLGTVAPGICSAPPDKMPIPDGVTMFAPTSTLTDTLGYLATRKTDDGWELGAVAHGSQAETLAGQLAEHIVRWSREVRGGPGMVVTIVPADAPARADAPETGVVVTRHRRITVSWPQWGDPTSDIGLKA